MTVGGVKAHKHKHKHKQKHRHKHTATSTSASVMTVRGVKATRDMHLMHGHALEQEVEMCINIFDWNICVNVNIFLQNISYLTSSATFPRLDVKPKNWRNSDR